MTGITASDSQDEKARKGEFGPLADKRMDPKEAQMEGQLSTSVAAQVADDGIFEALAEDDDASADDLVHGMAARLARDKRNPSYEWASEPRGDEIERGDGWTQATYEQARGREHEADRHRQKAHLAHEHDIDRAAKCRDDIASSERWYRTRHGSTEDMEDAVPVTESHWRDQHVSKFQTVGDGPEEESVTTEPEADPREAMDRETLKAVNQNAQRLADYFGHEGVSRPGFAKLIARRVDRGQSTTSAMLDIKRSIERLPTVAQDLDTIDPYDQWETTVEGVVETLYTPKHGSQRQVGKIADDSGSEVKFVVWQNSGDKPVLHEGDTVRLERARVNVYQGAPTLAVVGDTGVTHLEKPDDRGPAPRLKTYSEDPTPPRWSADRQEHSWINDINMDRAIPLTKERMAVQREQLRSKIHSDSNLTLVEHSEDEIAMQIDGNQDVSPTAVVQTERLLEVLADHGEGPEDA
jgi:hypothetical protein